MLAGAAQRRVLELKAQELGNTAWASRTEGDVALVLSLILMAKPMLFRTKEHLGSAPSTLSIRHCPPRVPFPRPAFDLWLAFVARKKFSPRRPSVEEPGTPRPGLRLSASRAPDLAARGVVPLIASGREVGRRPDCILVARVDLAMPSAPLIYVCTTPRVVGGGRRLRTRRFQEPCPKPLVGAPPSPSRGGTV